MKPYSLRWFPSCGGWALASLAAGRLAAASSGELSISGVAAGPGYFEFDVNIRNNSTAGETLYIQSPGSLHLFHGADIVPPGTGTWSFTYVPGSADAALAPLYATLGTTYDLSYTAGVRQMDVTYDTTLLGDASAPVNCPLTVGQAIRVGTFRLTLTSGDLVGGQPVNLDWVRSSGFTAFVDSDASVTAFTRAAKRSLVAAPTFATPGAPIVASASASDVAGGGVKLAGNVTSDGGYPVTERGFVYAATSDNSNPTLGGAGVTRITASGTTGAFDVTVTGLPGKTSYRFRSYAINQGGTTYSQVQTFTTLSALQAWRVTHFGNSSGVGNGANNHVGFPNGNGDKLTNMEKFAFGIDPATDVGNTRVSVNGNTVTRGKPNVNFQGGPLTGLSPKARFVRRKTHATDGLVYSVRFSADLLTWQTSAVTPTSIANDGEYEVVEVPYVLSVNGRKATFFKVEVNLVP